MSKKNGWKELFVNDLIEAGHAETKTGPFGTQLKASNYVDSGTPVINVRNIGFGTIRPDKLEFIGPDTVERLSTHLLLEEDIVFGRKGAVERHAFIRPEQRHWFQGSDCLRLRFNANNIVLPRFVSYFLLTEEHKSWMMNQCSHGATMASLNQEIISRIPLRLPSLPTQRKVASILSAYDDLIENNTRRIAILEEMAQAVYREWFVNFRFPGHENVKLVDSPLGQIPEGWVAGVVNDLLKLLSGFAFKSKTFVDDGGYKVVTIKHVHDGEFQTNSMSLLDSPPDRMPAHCHLETADVLMSLTGNIGRTCLVFGESFLLNQRVAKLHPHRPQDRPLVYWMFRSLDTRQRLEQIANGVAQQNLSPVQTGKMEVPIPPVELRDSYAEVASPMVEAILNLNRKNANLRTTRDLLLPKLISGKLDVEDLDIDSGLTAEALEEATA